MVESESSQKRFSIVFCKKCKTKFEISSPDNKHIFAAQTKAAFKISSPSESNLSEDQITPDDEIIELEHECPNCKVKNKIFWGAPKFSEHA